MSPLAPPKNPPRVRRRLRRGPAPRAGEPFPLKRRGRSKLPVKHEMHRATAFALIGALTLLGAAIRLIATRGLSLDEIRTVDQAHLPLSGLITRLAHGGTYPPLNPILEWCAVHLIGNQNVAVRLPALLAGIALIPAVAWLASELYERRTAVVAGLFASVAPVLVWYSQDASGYVLVALFGTLAVLGTARAIRRGHPGDWALHAVGSALAVWSDWSGIFIVLATELVLLGALL